MEKWAPVLLWMGNCGRLFLCNEYSIICVLFRRILQAVDGSFWMTAAEVALTSSLQSLVYIATFVPVSWMYQRLNGRVVVLAGSVLMGLGLALSSQAATLW